MPKIFFPIIREFNNLSYFNSLVYDMKKQGDIVKVFCPKKHMGVYSYADSLLVNPNSVYDRCTTEYIEPNKERFIADYMGEINRAKQISKEEHVDAPTQFDYFAYHIGNNWYSSIFSNTAKMLINEKENFKWCVPEQHRYEYWYTQRPYVVVNGRWLQKGNGTEVYNDKMENVIGALINKGMKVVNTTLNKPGLSYNPQLYIEAECVDYLEQLAIFSNANMVYSIANAGAINQHLLCKANFFLYAHGQAWVDNPLYGYNGVDVCSARKKISTVVTERSEKTYPKVIDAIVGCADCIPPTPDQFFDINKVTYL